MRFKEIAAGVWLTTVCKDKVNVLLVAGDQEAMLIDSGDSPEVGAEILAAAQCLVNVPIKYVVITHSHYDHWHGLPGMSGVTSIAHENILSTDTPADLRPDHTFSLIYALDLGNRFIEIVHFGEAHTRSDVIVVIHGANVIAVGDLLEDEPQFDELSTPSNWAKALDSAIGSANADTIFVPGHGLPTDRQEALLCCSKISYLVSTVTDLLARGTQPESIYQSVATWPLAEETVRAAIPFIVQELNARGLEYRRQLPIRGI